MSGTVSSLRYLIPLILLLAACQPAPPSPEPVVETLVVAEEVTATPVEVIRIVTPTSEPDSPRTLIICQGHFLDGCAIFSAIDFKLRRKKSVY